MCVIVIKPIIINMTRSNEYRKHLPMTARVADTSRAFAFREGGGVGGLDVEVVVELRDDEVIVVPVAAVIEDHLRLLGLAL
jgi:hypothetical protein